VTPRLSPEQIPAFACVIAFCVAGCSSAANEVARPVDDAIVVGMPLDDALDRFRKSGIQVQQAGFEMTNAKGEAMDQYVVLRPATPDALFLTSDPRKDGKAPTVDTMVWWKDYVHEVERPKGRRKYEMVKLERVSLKELK
jgi:hypothetical protein